jgi:hypothetical protein
LTSRWRIPLAAAVLVVGSLGAAVGSAATAGAGRTAAHPGTTATRPGGAVASFSAQNATSIAMVAGSGDQLDSTSAPDGSGGFSHTWQAAS